MTSELMLNKIFVLIENFHCDPTDFTEMQLFIHQSEDIPLHFRMLNCFRYNSSFKKIIFVFGHTFYIRA